MKKNLFAFLLLAVSVSMWADEPYILRNQPTRDTLAVFQQVGENTGYLAAEVTLTDDINKVEITQDIGIGGTAWYGPDWENYASDKSDKDGYCWWTCPEFVEGKVTANIASGSGTRNHIGIIIPKGIYRFSFVRIASMGENYFMIEQLPEPSNIRNLSACVRGAKRLTDGNICIVTSAGCYNSNGQRIP